MNFITLSMICKIIPPPHPIHIQQDIMTEVIVERGIMLGRSKWRHSSEHGQKTFSSVTN